VAGINSIFLVMNLLVLLRAFFARCFRGAASAISDLTAITRHVIARIPSLRFRPLLVGFTWALNY